MKAFCHYSNEQFRLAGMKIEANVNFKLTWHQIEWLTNYRLRRYGIIMAEQR